jgi:hypothetical protein
MATFRVRLEVMHYGDENPGTSGRNAGFASLAPNNPLLDYSFELFAVCTCTFMDHYENMQAGIVVHGRFVDHGNTT